MTLYIYPAGRGPGPHKSRLLAMKTYSSHVQHACLGSRRGRGQMLIVYTSGKIPMDMPDMQLHATSMYVSSFFSLPLSSRSHYSLRNPHSLPQVLCHSSHRLKDFLSSAIALWNRLPSCICFCKSSRSFLAELDNHFSLDNFSFGLPWPVFFFFFLYVYSLIFSFIYYFILLIYFF